MIRTLTIALVAFTLVVQSAPAKALMIAPPNVSQRVLSSPVIVMGKITALEMDPVLVAQEGSPNKISYQVGTFKIAEALKGGNGLTHLRIGVVMPMVAPPVPIEPEDGNIRIRRPILSRSNPFQIKLEENMEGVFFLVQHPTENFYIMSGMALPLLKNSESFAKDMGLIKKTMQVLSDPMKGLKSDKAEERGFTAVTLLTAYRTPPQPVKGAPANPKMEAVPLEESKLIMSAIAEQDWKKFNPELGIQPWQSYFFQLGANEQTGYVAPKFMGQPNYNDLVQESARAWIAKNAETHRIQRFAIAKK